MKPPSPYSALPSVISQNASPKAISRRTSYIRVRLEFLRYPQVITDYFNRRVFGPPQRFTAASTCSWIGHPVSGLRRDTIRPLQTRFRFGSETLSLNLASHRNSPARSTKSTTPRACGAVSACKHTVSGSFSLPSRGSFHLSLTVLYSIGHMVVFSLRRWSSYLPSGFLVSRRTPDTTNFVKFSNTGVLPSSLYLSRYVLLTRFLVSRSPYPVRISTYGLGSSDFARHYFRNRYFLSFPLGNEMFQFPRFPSLRYGFT